VGTWYAILHIFYVLCILEFSVLFVGVEKTTLLELKGEVASRARMGASFFATRSKRTGFGLAELYDAAQEFYEDDGRSADAVLTRRKPCSG
jgi:hypothetical protein